MSRPTLREFVHEVVDVTPADLASPNAFASIVEAAMLRSRLEAMGRPFPDGKIGGQGPTDKRSAAFGLISIALRPRPSGGLFVRIQYAPFNVHEVEQVVVVPRSHLMHAATH